MLWSDWLAKKNFKQPRSRLPNASPCPSVGQMVEKRAKCPQPHTMPPHYLYWLRKPLLELSVKVMNLKRNFHLSFHFSMHFSAYCNSCFSYVLPSFSLFSSEFPPFFVTLAYIVNRRDVTVLVVK